ncbi:MAG: ComF family protein [Crocinitomicaceae bacterium]|nr:ComF family protein [Crocinitomicaceae bacterium]
MNRKKRLQPLSIADDVIHLVYPSLCLVCENELSRSEEHVCSICQHSLTHTHFQLFEEPTEMDKLFWGRVQVKATYAHLFFKKNRASQKILFNLKYKNNPALGEYFGKKMGECMKQNALFNNIDAIIPVPLHYKKEFLRGYNQSDSIANGIGQHLNVPVDFSSTKRRKHTTTQTQKSRFQRWDNVNDIFQVKDTLLRYKHVVLIDDVITTGATMEALIRILKEKAPALDVSVVTLAIA